MRHRVLALLLIALLPACNTERGYDLPDDYHSRAYERSMQEWGRERRWRHRADYMEDRRKDDRR